MGIHAGKEEFDVSGHLQKVKKLSDTEWLQFYQYTTQVGGYDFGKVQNITQYYSLTPAESEAALTVYRERNNWCTTHENNKTTLIMQLNSEQRVLFYITSSEESNRSLKETYEGLKGDILVHKSEYDQKMDLLTGSTFFSSSEYKTNSVSFYNARESDRVEKEYASVSLVDLELARQTAKQQATEYYNKINRIPSKYSNEALFSIIKRLQYEVTYAIELKENLNESEFSTSFNLEDLKLEIDRACQDWIDNKLFAKDCNANLKKSSLEDSVLAKMIEDYKTSQKNRDSDDKYENCADYGFSLPPQK